MLHPACVLTASPRRPPARCKVGAGQDETGKRAIFIRIVKRQQPPCLPQLKGRRPGAPNAKAHRDRRQVETARCGSSLFGQRRYAVGRAAVRDVLQGLEHLRCWTTQLLCTSSQPCPHQLICGGKHSMVFRNNLHHRLPPRSRTSLWTAVCSVLTVDHGRLTAACRASSSGLELPGLGPVPPDARAGLS
jgi:hypothetical protein